MFTIYVDDSGTSPSQQIAVAAALVAPETRWERFAEEWKRFRVKEQFSCFHTSECVANNRHSEFADWDEQKKLRIIRRIRQLTKKFAVHAIALGLYKPFFDEVVTGEFREVAGKNHYTIAIRSLFGDMGRWRKRCHPQLYCDRWKYVFDWMEPATDGRREEVEDVLKIAEQASDALEVFGGFKGFYSFRKRCDLAPLQAVDLLAWSYYQAARHYFTKSAIHPIAKETMLDYGAFADGTWLDSRLWSKKRLQDWVMDPRALRAIEKNKQARAVIRGK